MQEATFEKLLQQEHEWLEREESRRIEANDSDDTTPWLDFMQWKKTFHGKDLAVRKIYIIADDILVDQLYPSSSSQE